MGAYIFYQLVNKKETDKIENWISKQEEQGELKKYQRGLWFWSNKDIAIEKKRLKETGRGCPNYKKLGAGDWKASGFEIKEEHLYKIIANLFKKLHKIFKVKIYSGSCALSTDYFSKAELKQITKNGNALSGKYKNKILKIII